MVLTSLKTKLTKPLQAMVTNAQSWVLTFSFITITILIYRSCGLNKIQSNMLHSLCHNWSMMEMFVNQADKLETRRTTFHTLTYNVNMGKRCGKLELWASRGDDISSDTWIKMTEGNISNKYILRQWIKKSVCFLHFEIAWLWKTRKICMYYIISYLNNHSNFTFFKTNFIL